MENNSGSDSVDIKVEIEPKYPTTSESSQVVPPNEILCISQQFPVVDSESAYYEINHKQRGLAIIFDNFSSESLEERKGLEKDREQLVTTFRRLGFDVRPYTDRTRSQIEMDLQQVAEMNHESNDCIAVIVRSPGNSSRLKIRNESFDVDKLWHPFFKCQSLVGKPKLFFIQTCGEESKTIEDVVDSRSDKLQSFKIPTMADLLVMSYEESHGGARFNQALCEELDANGRNDELFWLLTGINRRVVSKLQSSNENNNKPMIPSIVSTLTKNLHFTQKDSDRAYYLHFTQKDSDLAYYDMIHEQRGLAIIFNHFEFTSGSEVRNGTAKDAERLEKTFRKLGFDVRIHEDRTKSQIKEILKMAAYEDHQDNDCVAVIVLSHGKSGELEALDGSYDVDDIWKPFLNSQALNGKPKLFFIQACRGEEVDPGVTVTGGDMTDSPDFDSQYYQIPAMADVLVMYATYEGHFAFRNANRGSCFIQTLCDEFDANGTTDDLLQLLTGVNRKVAFKFQSTTDNSKLNAKKQMPTIVSMLTKVLYFTRKTN